MTRLIRQYWLWPTVAIIGVIALLLMPGDLVDTSRRFVHGLCAQTPSHTFVIDSRMLPFDARMTGIYAGAGVTMAYLAIRRRWLGDGLPSRPLLAALTVLIAAMVLDGTNSLLTDLGVWHPWRTTNITRLVTGYGAGIAIAVALAWLVASTLWQLADRQPALRTWADLLWVLSGLVVLGMLLWWSPSWLYVPLTLVLIVSAWLVVSILVLTATLLGTRRDVRVVALRQLHVPGAVAAVAGLVVIVVLASGRRWLEIRFGIPANL